MWTPPHFWALALYRAGDYADAGVPMLPVVAGAATTKRQMLFYTVVLLPITLVPVALGVVGALYATGALIIGVLFLVAALRVMRDETDLAPRQMFGFSIFYLFAIFALLIADKGLA
jgi:protoheme IX farnesyltransferase